MKRLRDIYARPQAVLGIPQVRVVLTVMLVALTLAVASIPFFLMQYLWAQVVIIVLTVINIIGLLRQRP